MCHGQCNKVNSNHFARYLSLYSGPTKARVCIVQIFLPAINGSSYIYCKIPGANILSHGGLNSLIIDSGVILNYPLSGAINILSLISRWPHCGLLEGGRLSKVFY
jgi:hypothetical protein